MIKHVGISRLKSPKRTMQITKGFVFSMLPTPSPPAFCLLAELEYTQRYWAIKDAIKAGSKYREEELSSPTHSEA